MDDGVKGEKGLVLLVLAAATSMMVGLLWDISWDASFGKDSFWSPPHVALNFGAMALVAIAAAAVVSATSSGAAAAVRIGGVRAPFGFALVLWGGLAMLGWAIVDAWWSSAYGLYADAWSPPQILFLVSLAALLCGTGVAAATLANKRGGGAMAAAWAAALLVHLAAVATAPYNLPNVQRTTTFLVSASVVYPPVLACAAAYRPAAWSATVVAAGYMALVCVLVWVFPLFPATPLIGPIYEPVEHLLPPRFPLLLVLPAIAFDLIVRDQRNRALCAALAGVSFVAVLGVVQWYFSGFLLDPASDSWFFAGGARHWPFYMEIGAERAFHWGVSEDPITVPTVVVGIAVATAGAWLGSSAGRWLRGVRR